MCLFCPGGEKIVAPCTVNVSGPLPVSELSTAQYQHFFFSLSVLLKSFPPFSLFTSFLYSFHPHHLISLIQPYLHSVINVQLHFASRIFEITSAQKVQVSTKFNLNSFIRSNILADTARFLPRSSEHRSYYGVCHRIRLFKR